MKTRNVRARQRSKYRRKHFAYCRKYNVHLVLPWTAYGWHVPENIRLEAKQTARWVRENLG